MYRVPLCVPFWTWRTYLALARCCAFGRVVSGRDVQRLEHRLAAFFSTDSAVTCSSGRGALELALRATGIGAGDEVIVPTFCCASIIPPVLAIGSVPVLADVGVNLTLTPETVEAVRSPRTRAVVVAHLFGNPAAIDAIADVCRRQGLVMIDDAAQALGATLGGKPLGTFGDAGIVSFGNGKICFGIGGGTVVSRQVDVLTRASAIHSPPEELAQTLKQAARVVLWRHWRRWSLPLYVAMTRVLGATDEPPYRRGAMPNLAAAVASSLMDTLHANLAARRARVDAYQRLLGPESGLSLMSHEEGSACLTQLVRFDGGEPVALKVVRVLRDAGYEVGRSFEPLHAQPRYSKYARGAMPCAEASWRSLVELPCEPSVRIQDVRRIAELVLATVTASHSHSLCDRCVHEAPRENRTNP